MSLRWLFAYPDRSGETWKEPEPRKLGQVNADGSYIGGALISLIRVMEGLRARGHHVDLDVPTAGPPDVLVCCREPSLVERYPELSEVKKVVWLHDIDRREELLRYRGELDGAITVSPFLSSLYEDLGLETLTSTNPLDPVEVPRATPETLSLCFAGMFIPERGVDFAIRVLARLLPDFPRARLELYGSYSLWMSARDVGRLHCHPSYLPTVEAALDGLPDRQAVRFRGNVANLELLRELARHHLLLVPAAVDESCSMVSIEAQSVGTVVIASDRGALPDTVGEGGLNLPLDEDLWARQITQLVRGGLEERSRAAKRHFERRFGMEETLDGWTRFLERLGREKARCA